LAPPHRPSVGEGFLAIRPRPSALAVVLVALVPVGGAAAQEPPPSPPPPPPNGTQAPRREPAGYRIAPGDVLHIMVWNEPSLSTDAPVRLDGKITVPLLAAPHAAGRTPDE